MISQNIINRIIEEVDIVETVASYIPLTPKGKNYWAVCPFHNDSNPSMSVSREKKFFPSRQPVITNTRLYITPSSTPLQTARRRAVPTPSPSTPME